MRSVVSGGVDEHHVLGRVAVGEIGDRAHVGAAVPLLGNRIGCTNGFWNSVATLVSSRKNSTRSSARSFGTSTSARAVRLSA